MEFTEILNKKCYLGYKIIGLLFFVYGVVKFIYSIENFMQKSYIDSIIWLFVILLAVFLFIIGDLTMQKNENLQNENLELKNKKLALEIQILEKQLKKPIND